MKKKLFGIVLILSLVVILFSGCDINGDSPYPENKPATSKIIFDESKISCKDTSSYFEEREIKNGDSLELGIWYLTFKAKEYESDNVAIWSINGEEKDPVYSDTYSIRGEFGTDYSIKVGEKKYQMTVDVTVREPINPKIEFDENSFRCYSYDWSERNAIEINSGDRVKEANKLKFTSKNPDKIITSYTINGKSHTDNIESLSIDNVYIRDILVSPENTSDDALKMEITTRDIVKANLVISDDDVVCIKRINIKGEQTLTNGDEVKERDILSFYHKQRGFMTDGYYLNGTLRTDKLYNGFVNEITVSEDTVKEGKFELSFKTHEALSVNVTINEDIPFFEIKRYASKEVLRSTGETINRNSLTLYEGEEIRFWKDNAFSESLYGFTVNGEVSKTRGGPLSKIGEKLFLIAARQEIPLTDGCEFQKLAE